VETPEIINGEGLTGFELFAHQIGFTKEKLATLSLTLTIKGYSLHTEGAGLFCKKYATFEIFCQQSDGTSWTIYRRYSQFHDLDAKLKRLGLLPRTDPTLPAKTGLKRQNDEEAVVERMTGLQIYLDKVVSLPEIRTSESVFNLIQPVQLGDIKPGQTAVQKKDKE